MNKILTMVILLILVLPFHIYGKGMSNAVGIPNEFMDIIHTMNKNKIDIKSWSIYTREKTAVNSMNEVKEKYKDLRHTFPNLKWGVKEKSGHWQAVGSTGSTIGIQERVVLTAYSSGNKSANYYLVYDVSGSKWDIDLWEQFSEKYNQNIADIFRKNTTKFSCVRGELSDNMEGVLYQRAEKLLKEFSAIPVEAMKEETFVSVSAYTEKWNNAIPTKNGNFNIQLALRNQGLGGKINVAIGTPIITSEY